MRPLVLAFALGCAPGAAGCSGGSSPEASGPTGSPDDAAAATTKTDDAGGVDATVPGSDAPGDLPEDGGATSSSDASVDLHRIDGGAFDASTPDARSRTVVDAAVTPCRNSTDCPSGDFCIGARGGGSCKTTCPGAPCAISCDAGICRTSRATGTCSAAPTTTYCMPKCVTNEDCPLDTACEPMSGTCFGPACTNGLLCPAWEVCRGAMWAAFCIGNTCTSDADCPGAYCVTGTCQSTLGFCAPSCN